MSTVHTTRRRVLERGANFLMALTAASSAQAQSGNTSAAPEISAQAAQQDLRLLQRAFKALHPGLYRYSTEAQIDADFAAALVQVAGGASRAQLFLLASRLAASVRCGHTWASPYNQSALMVKEVFERADKLPFTLRLVDGRFLVTASALSGLAAGTELLAVDGHSAAHIVQSLLPYVRADGRGAGSDAKRLSQLSDGRNGGAMDRLFPLLFAPTASGWRLRVQDAGAMLSRELLAAPMALADRQRVLLPPPMPAAAWQFQIEGDTAVLTLPTFAFWNGGFDAKAFLQRSFDAMRAKQVPYLIVDIRQNEGGDDAIGRALLAHLLKQPYTVPATRTESAYERVPYALARYLDSWDFSFFDRTGQVARGPGRNWQLPEKPALTIEPVATPYAGRTLLLVGPQNSSAGYLLARDVQRSAAATLLGQPTGGNLRGLNGGQLAWITLPASGVGVDIPLIASFATADEPDAGITPEVLVAARYGDAAAGIDTEWVAAQALISQWRQAGR